MIFGTMDPYALEILAAQPDIAGITGYTIDYPGMRETLSISSTPPGSRSCSGTRPR
jgi:hypothetical protein